MLATLILATPHHVTGQEGRADQRGPPDRDEDDADGR
jgi:hypothetical protein